MKKYIAILICLIMLITCAACGGTENETVSQPQSPSGTAAPSASGTTAPSAAETTAPSGSAENTPVQTAGSGDVVESVLKLGAVNSVAGYTDFALRKVITTDIVACNFNDMSHKLYMKPDKIYVDVVFDWTNVGTTVQLPYEVMTAAAVTPDGTELTGEVLIEAPDMEGNPRAALSIFDEMEPQSPQVLHAVFLADSNTESLDMKFSVQNCEFTYEYTLGDIITDAEELKPGDVLESDMAKLEFIGISYTDELEPVNKGNGSYYSIHVQGVDEAISTLLDAKFRLTSKLDTELDAMYFLYMNAKYGDDFKTYYDSLNYSSAFYETVGWDGLPGFDSLVAPDETYEINYLITTLEDNMDRPLALFLEFDGKEYVYRVE